MFGDLLEALLDRLVGEMIEADIAADHVIEQRLQLVVEQRQPLLHARIALAVTDGLIQRIVAGRAAEQLNVTAAEGLLGFLTERDFAHRQQDQLLQQLLGPLSFRIEGLDALQCVAEEIEPDWSCPSRRKQVEDATTNRELARLHHRAGTYEAAKLQPHHQPVHVDALAGRHLTNGKPHPIARRHALQDGIHGRQHQRRVATATAEQTRQRRHSLGNDLGIRPDTVVRHRVPGRKYDHPHLRIEEAQRRLQGLEAAIVAGDVHHQTRSGPRHRLARQTREHQRIEALRHSGQNQVMSRQRIHRIPVPTIGGGLKLNKKT